jgi:hypothetical protein
VTVVNSPSGGLGVGRGVAVGTGVSVDAGDEVGTADELGAGDRIAGGWNAMTASGANRCSSSIHKQAECPTTVASAYGGRKLRINVDGAGAPARSPGEVK